MKPSVEDRIISRLKEFTESLENNEVISEKFTCRKVQLNLQPTTYQPELVKLTRALLGASQAIFAQFLGVATNTIQAWEQGTLVPNDMACRFMDEIRHDPKRWQKRFKSLLVQKV